MTEVLNVPEKCMNHDDMECSDPTTTIEDSPSSAKKLKQARLPFKPIGPKSQLTLTPHGLPKKRKLSDQESPSAKAAKVASKHPCDRGRLETVEKPPAPIEHENEVSSSSEAENIPIGSSQKRKGFENNILERFVRKSSQEEISSTNEVVDLTEENESNSNAPSTVSPVKSTETKEQTQEEESVITLEDSDNNENQGREKNTENIKTKDPKSSDAKSISKLPKVSTKKNEIEESAEVSKENVESNSRTTKNEPSDDVKNVPFVPNTTKTTKDEDNVMTEKSEALNSSCKTDIALEVSSNGDKSKDKSLDSSLSSSKSVSDESSSSEDNSEDDANDSMADVSLSSPGNNSSVNTSICKTPTAKGANLSGSTKTPGGSSVQTSTPKSARGKPQSLKMSEIKSQERKKEREALRQRAREQKEEQQRERKRKKEQEKMEAKRRRDEEKAEREKKKLEEKEKKEREKMEKKEQLEKEKMEKQQQREEEKKKKQELIDAKLEEKKKKEEEKRLKEEEKLKEEEEKNKKKMKAKETFSSFFIKKTQQQASKPKESCLFMPFEVKKDMFLAPPCRRQLGDDDKTSVDEYLTKQECASLYLADLKKPSYEKGRSARTLPRVKDEEPAPEVECEGEVDCLETTESAEKKKILERHHCKLLQFHTNYRPPYYGTWRKRSDVIKPTKPFSQDTELLDYEVDSDDEWEEEEPGESVSSSEDEGEEKEDEGEEEEEEDGWMVPHGYLSEDEGCDQDEEITPELMKARQMAKQEAWEAEQKRQRAPVKAIVIGCHWDGEEVAERLAAKLAQFRAVCLSAVPMDTRKKMAETGGKEGEKNGTGKGNRKPVPEEAMPDLIRLLHHNVIGIKKVIKEFRLYWKKKTSNTLGEGETDNMEVDEGAAEKDLSTLDQSVTEEKSSKDGETEAASPGGDEDKAQECADGCGMSKRQLEIKIGAIAVREKRPEFKKVCWYVHDKILKQYGMEDLPLVNAWQYVSKGLIRVKNEEACGRKTPNSLSESFSDAVQVIMKDEEEEVKAEKPKDQPSIMQFAKKMQPSELPKPKIRRIELKPALPTAQTSDDKQVSPVAELDTSANEEVVAPYKVLPKDQRSIMDFAKKPTSSPKSGKKPSKITPKKTVISPLVKKPIKTDVVTSQGETTKKEPSIPVAAADKATPSAKISKTPDEAMEVEECIVLD